VKIKIIIVITGMILLKQQCNSNVGPSCPWTYDRWIYNYLCNQCLSPLMVWVQISMRARCAILCDKVCQWLATGQWFSSRPLVFSTKKTDHHDITDILLKVVLNIIKQTNIHISIVFFFFFIRVTPQKRRI
jgi:hypothetical protein